MWCYFYYVDILMTAFLTIFRRFPTTFQRFPKILQNLSEGHTNVTEHFPKVSEDFRKLPKTFEEDPKMFRWYTSEFKYNFKRDELHIVKSSISSLVRIWKIYHSSPGCGFVWILRVVYFPVKDSCLYNKSHFNHRGKHRISNLEAKSWRDGYQITRACQIRSLKKA